MLRLMSIEFMKPSNHLTSAIPFSSCLQSSPALGSFLMSQFLASGGQSIGASTSASVLPMNVQDWFLLKRGAFLVLLRAALCWVRSHMLYFTQVCSGAQVRVNGEKRIRDWFRPWLFSVHQCLPSPLLPKLFSPFHPWPGTYSLERCWKETVCDIWETRAPASAAVCSRAVWSDYSWSYSFPRVLVIPPANYSTSLRLTN